MMFDYIYISEPITKVNISITPKIFLMPCGNLSLLKQTSLQPPARQTLIYFLPLLICLYFLEFSMYVIRQSLFSFFSFLFFFFDLAQYFVIYPNECVAQQFCHLIVSSIPLHRQSTICYSFTYYAHFRLLSVRATTNFGIYIFSYLFCKYLGVKSEKAMAHHSSTLAWKIPWMKKPGRLQSMVSLRVGHD